MRRESESTIFLERLRSIMPETSGARRLESSDGDDLRVDDRSEAAVPSSAGDSDVDGSPRRAAQDRARQFLSRHAKAFSVVAMAVVIVTTWSVMRARAIPANEPYSSPVVVTPAPTPTPQMWVVHVVGAVASPGVISLPAGSRVIDAVVAAGGFRDDADAAELNLAAPISDGVQVIIGTRMDPRGEVRVGASGNAGSFGSTTGSSAGGSGNQTGKIDLNTATAAQLDTLPGVGEVTAAAILTWRERNGSFSSVAQLQEVDGIGPKTFAQIEPLVCV